MASSIVYSSRARWCPSRSFLGYVLWLKVKNHRQAEAWYLIIISSMIVMLIVMQFLSWSLWHEEITGNSGDAMWYWVIQLGVAGFILIGGFIGYTPRVHVALTESSLRVSQGKRSAMIHRNSMIDCRVVSALRYYRDWNRRVDRYMTHTPDDVLLIFTEQKITAIGINSDAHAILLDAMNKVSSVKTEVHNAV